MKRKLKNLTVIVLVFALFVGFAPSLPNIEKGFNTQVSALVSPVIPEPVESSISTIPFNDNNSLSNSSRATWMGIEYDEDDDDYIDVIYKNEIAKIYSVNFEEEESYDIRLESQDFDSYLYLISSKGALLVDDDDNGMIGPNHIRRNSRIIFDSENDDKYYIVVSSYENKGLGSYKFSIKNLEETHTVTFNSNGGSYIAPQIFDDGDYLEDFQNINPFRTGYYFAGWYDHNGNKCFYYDEDGDYIDRYKIIDSITLTAHWILIPQPALSNLPSVPKVLKPTTKKKTITFKFTPISNVTHYILRYKIKGKGKWKTKKLSSSAKSYKIKKLKKGKKYQIQIKGVNSSGSGSWSKISTVKCK